MGLLAGGRVGCCETVGAICGGLETWTGVGDGFECVVCCCCWRCCVCCRLFMLLWALCCRFCIEAVNRSYCAAKLSAEASEVDGPLGGMASWRGCGRALLYIWPGSLRVAKGCCVSELSVEG